MEGGIAYVADDDGLRIIDVSDKEAPVEIGHFDTPGEYHEYHDLTVRDGYAYVSDYLRGLRIIDVSDPSSPSEVGAFASTEPTFNLDLDGSYIYLGDDILLRIIDISDPTNPVQVASYYPSVRSDRPGSAPSIQDVDAGEGLAVVGTSNGIAVLDISNPTAPLELSYQYLNVGVSNLAVVRNLAPGHGSVLAYFPLSAHGISIFDLTNPASPEQLSFYSILSNARSVDLTKPYAFVSDMNYGLRVIDISNPWVPLEIADYAVSHSPPGYSEYLTGVTVQKDRVYLAYASTFQANLYIIDVSDPKTPLSLGSYWESAYFEDVSVGRRIAGGVRKIYAYLTYEYDNGDVRVLDVSDPASPIVVGFLETPGWATGIAVERNKVYVADRAEGLRILDVTDPFNAFEIGYLDTPGTASDIVIVDKIAYLADGSALRVIDVSNPAVPVELGSCEPSGSVVKIALSGTYAYVLGFEGVLSVIDITDPTGLSEVDFVELPGPAYDLAVDGFDVYLAAGGNGLFVLRLSPYSLHLPGVRVGE